MNPSATLPFFCRDKEGTSQTKTPWELLIVTAAMILHQCSSLFNEKFSMDRLAMLTEILAHSPNDAFARYGLALEHSNRGETEKALEEFGKLLAAHPDYTAGYFMAAQTLAKAARPDDAKKMLGNGIASAKRTGNAHALSEMEAMLAELS
jgi:predicted Zn-dependent protease